MLSQVTLLKISLKFGVLLAVIFASNSVAIAAVSHSQPINESAPITTQFQQIEQPLANKILVTFGGIGLIGLELWWFLLSKPKSQKAVASSGGIQEVNITVDGGYKPSRIVVQARKTVRLNFQRKDSNSCLEKVLIPDFHIAADLPLNSVTSVEFTPEAGTYVFSCGMNMFRGEIIAEAEET
ncbi:MAG TPA: cupredoxin domain-containing protein [Kamptonema sp.]|nr:cupredoxin domain-containing protein [Kamptonema sp.]